MEQTVLIKGGTVVTATNTFEADIAISGGTIAAIGHDLGEAREIVDATGKPVATGRDLARSRTTTCR